MKKGIYFCDENSWDRVYGVQQRRQLGELVEVPEILVTRENWRAHKELLKEADVLLST